MQPAPAAAADCEQVLAPDLKSICERGELRVARYGGERPPFFFRRDGEWVGFDVDLGRDIARRLGVGYAEDPTAPSFDAVVDRVAAGEADLAVSKLSNTLARAQRVRFSNAYLTVYQALLVNRLSSPTRGDPFEALDTSGVVVGALGGSSYVGYGESLFPQAEVRSFDDFEAMMSNVVGGRIDAALMDSARANTWRQANRESLIHVRTTIDRSRKDPLAIAVAWENTHLLSWVNLYLQRIRADGTARELYHRWFGAAAGEPSARP
jgi:ABC-type amino acid transport substrate-binding protein